MRRESPQEYWERVRSTAGGDGRPPAPSGAAPLQPAQDEQPARVSDRPAGNTPAPDQGTHSTPPQQAQTEGASSGELVKQLVDQTKTLVQQEVRLAQLELQQKGKRIGIGAGLFGAGGLVAFFGAATLIAAVVLALSTALAPWLSALIVAVLLLAIAGATALKGKKEIEQATPPAPQQAIEGVKQDVDTVKRRARR